MNYLTIRAGTGVENRLACFLPRMGCLDGCRDTQRAGMPKHASGPRLRKNYEVSMSAFRASEESAGVY